MTLNNSVRMLLEILLRKRLAEIEAKEREEKEREKKYKKIPNEDLKRVGNEAKQVKAAWHAEGFDGDEKARKKYSKSFSTLKKDILRNSTGDNTMASKGEPTKTKRTTPSVKVKPAALKLETIKPTEPSLPSAQLQSLMTARQLRNINDSTYPSGTMPPRANLNNDAAPFEFPYDRNFLLQFSEAFVAKPSLDWDARLQRVMGTKASAISRKDNSLYEGYGGYETLDTFRPLKDNVQIFSTHSRGETTDLDRIIGDEDPFVAKAHARSLNGSFHRMTSPVCDRATDGDEPFSKHDVPSMPMRSEIQGSDLTRVSSLTEPCERASATASEQQRKTIRIRGFGGNRPSRPAKKSRDLDTHTLISADIKEGDITGRSELDEDAENSSCITTNFSSDNNPIDPDFSPQRDKGGYRTGQQRLEELLKLWTPLDAANR